MLALGLVLSSIASLGFALSVHIPGRHRALFSITCLLLRVLNGFGAAAVDTSSMAICTEQVLLLENTLCQRKYGLSKARIKRCKPRCQTSVVQYSSIPHADTPE